MFGNAESAFETFTSMLLSALQNVQISAVLKLVLKQGDSPNPRVDPRVHLRVNPEGRKLLTQTPK
jgi:hypothetical protein